VEAAGKAGEDEPYLSRVNRRNIDEFQDGRQEKEKGKKGGERIPRKEKKQRKIKGDMQKEVGKTQKKTKETLSRGDGSIVQ